MTRTTRTERFRRFDGLTLRDDGYRVYGRLGYGEEQLVFEYKSSCADPEVVGRTLDLLFLSSPLPTEERRKEGAPLPIEERIKSVEGALQFCAVRGSVESRFEALEREVTVIQTQMARGQAFASMFRKVDELVLKHADDLCTMFDELPSSQWERLIDEARALIPRLTNELRKFK